MDLSTTYNVNELLDGDKESLEHLLGTPLSDAQKVFTAAFTPNTEPDPHTRAEAADVIEHILDKAAAHAREQGSTEDEIDTAVDEAMLAVRQRKAP